jgi:hypothetical protein
VIAKDVHPYTIHNAMRFVYLYKVVPLRSFEPQSLRLALLLLHCTNVQANKELLIKGGERDVFGTLDGLKAVLEREEESQREEGFSSGRTAIVA